MQITEVLGLELMVHVSGEEVAFASLEVVLCWPSTDTQRVELRTFLIPLHLSFTRNGTLPP